MKRIRSSTWSSIFMVGLMMALGSVGTPAWGLGPAAPPQVGFAAVLVSTFSTGHSPGLTDGVPQLFAQVDLIVVPGGSVPANIASVTVEGPGFGPTALTKGTNDLFSPETFYEVNLTQAGVLGFLPGTYTFRVQDTAGGETVVTDEFSAVPPLGAPTDVTISGATQISPDLWRASFSSGSTPTVTWTPTPGAEQQRVRVRPFAGPDLFSRLFSDGSTNSTTLPGGLFTPGRVTQILVEAQDANFNTRGRRAVRLIVEGPEVLLSRTGGTGNGQTLTVNATVFNTGGPVTVDVRLWIAVPTGEVFTIVETTGVTIPSATQDAPLFSAPVFVRTWDGSEPTGPYVIGLRLTGPLGETAGLATLTFVR